MKLSTRALSGVRAMMAIAQGATQGPVMVKEIAVRQQLPATDPEPVMVPLRKSGLVSTTRGAHGGYTTVISCCKITPPVNVAKEYA
ncbi:MAG TPA: Rrf2 family transcriptional regulator [Armatimonadota bacterium]|jgi:Rrf2 family protein